MSGRIFWNGRELSFLSGETIAQALCRAGVANFGAGALGQPHSVFCGIGQCQNCLVDVVTAGPREACLTLCRDGLCVRSVGEPHG